MSVCTLCRNDTCGSSKYAGSLEYCNNCYDSLAEIAAVMNHPASTPKTYPVHRARPHASEHALIDLFVAGTSRGRQGEGCERGRRACDVPDVQAQGDVGDMMSKIIHSWVHCNAGRGRSERR